MYGGDLGPSLSYTRLDKIGRIRILIKINGTLLITEGTWEQTVKKELIAGITEPSLIKARAYICKG